MSAELAPLLLLLRSLTVLCLLMTAKSEPLEILRRPFGDSNLGCDSPVGET